MVLVALMKEGMLFHSVDAVIALLPLKCSSRNFQRRKCLGALAISRTMHTGLMVWSGPMDLDESDMTIQLKAKAY